MRTLLRKILFIATISIIALFVILYFSINWIIKEGIESVGPNITGTDVRLKKSAISLFSGTGKLKGIFIGNPQGFHTESAFRLNEVSMEIDILSLLSDRIIIKEIRVSAPEITYEVSGQSTNIKTIANNVKAFSRKSRKTVQEDHKDAKKEEKKLLINSFVIENGKVNMSATALMGEKASFPLPYIHLKNIGKEKSGLSAPEVADEIFKVVNRNVIIAVSESGLSLGRETRKAVDKVKSLFGK